MRRRLAAAQVRHTRAPGGDGREGGWGGGGGPPGVCGGLWGAEGLVRCPWADAAGGRGARAARRRAAAAMAARAPLAAEVGTELVAFRNALAALRRRLHGGARAADLDRDGVVVESVPLKLMCPAGGVRLSVPCRGDRCKHVDCFDRNTFFSVLEQKVSLRLRKGGTAAEVTPVCPICNAPVKTLRVDEVVLRLLAAAPEECETVTISRDLKWTPQLDDSDDEGGGGGGRGGGGGGKQEEVILLSDSDDEDDGGKQQEGQQGQQREQQEQGHQQEKQEEQEQGKEQGKEQQAKPPSPRVEARALSALPAVPTDRVRFGKRRIGANLSIKLPKLHPGAPAQPSAGLTMRRQLITASLAQSDAARFGTPTPGADVVAMVRPVPARAPATLPGPHVAAVAANAAIGAALADAQRQRSAMGARGGHPFAASAADFARSGAVGADLRSAEMQKMATGVAQLTGGSDQLSSDAANLLVALGGSRPQLVQAPGCANAGAQLQGAAGAVEVVELSSDEGDDAAARTLSGPQPSGQQATGTGNSTAAASVGDKRGREDMESGSQLTDEQRERIERNRQEALRRKAKAMLLRQHQSQLPVSQPPLCQQPGPQPGRPHAQTRPPEEQRGWERPLSPEQRERVRRNKEAAMARLAQRRVGFNEYASALMQGGSVNAGSLFGSGPRLASLNTALPTTQACPGVGSAFEAAGTGLQAPASGYTGGAAGMGRTEARSGPADSGAQTAPYYHANDGFVPSYGAPGPVPSGFAVHGIAANQSMPPVLGPGAGASQYSHGSSMGMPVSRLPVGSQLPSAPAPPRPAEDRA